MSAEQGTMKELYEEYIKICPIIRNLTKAQRDFYNVKAHVVQELLHFEFRFVPLNGQYVYMFKNECEAQQFDKLTNACGRKECNIKQ